MSLSVWVTRTELGLADLQLNQLPYKVSDWDPGQQAWRRTWVDSQMVHGRVLLHAAKEVRFGALDLLVAGDTQAGRDTNRTALTNAFSQFDYEVRRDIDGHVQAWRCEPADWLFGERYVEHQREFQRVTLTMPCLQVAVV